MNRNESIPTSLSVYLHGFKSSASSSFKTPPCHCRRSHSRDQRHPLSYLHLHLHLGPKVKKCRRSLFASIPNLLSLNSFQQHHKNVHHNSIKRRRRTAGKITSNSTHHESLILTWEIADCVGTVPPTPPTRLPIRRLQLPGIREAEDKRCVSGE